MQKKYLILVLYDLYFNFKVEDTFNVMEINIITGKGESSQSLFYIKFSGSFQNFKPQRNLI